MKNIFYSAIMMAMAITSCNGKSKEAGVTTSEKAEAPQQTAADPNTETAQNNVSTVSSASSAFSIDEIVSSYLNIKNALVKEDSKGAANAAKALFEVLHTLHPSSIDAKSRRQYAEITEEALEHAGHIGASVGLIAHQRAHFVMLSKDVDDLLALFPTSQKLYQDYCPMADDNRGAIWISEVKEINNPYGKSMLKCGSIKKEL